LNFGVGTPEWVEDTGVRFKYWDYAGHSHQMPDSTTLFQALVWVDQGVAQRRALAASFPSTRIGSAVSRAEQAKMELEDAQRKLQDDAMTYAGLMQLEGLCQRWPDVAACREAKRLLEEYEQRESRPWERQRIADRRKVIEAKIKALNRRAPTLELSDKFKHSRGRADYRHEYAELEWDDSSPPDATRLGIRTEYDEATQAVLERLGSRVSLDGHQRVAMVNLRGTRVTAAQFRHFKKQLQGMTDLRALDLSHTVMPEYVLSQVADLANLQALNLSKSSLTSRGMRHLSELRRLQFLAVAKTSVSSGGFRDLPLREMRVLIAGDTNVTDQLLEQLAQATNLRRLSVYSTRITSSGIANLVQLPSLTYLNLGSTKIGDAACPSLAKIATLEELILDKTRITDKGFAELVALRNLRRLSLKGTKVTDAGVKTARDMERLEFLNIKYTGVTKQGVDELRSLLSSCEVLWDDEVENRIAAERRQLQQELRSLEEQEQLPGTTDQP
jgi:Leucine-rich repeat (LRR) protein